MRRNRPPKINALQPLTSLPVLPECLRLDQQALPLTYVPPDWTADIVGEWQCEARLIAAGTYPTQSALIHGPSGVGKTTAARWIASILCLPVYTVLLSTSIDSLLGGTGKNLDASLRYASAEPCVLVMDEIDAVAASRGSGRARDGASGEMRRVTNTLIQILDYWHGERKGSLLIATTNLIDSIDVAIRRRFEVELEVPMPSLAELSKMAGVELPDDFTASHADMSRLIVRARRQAVIRGTDYAQALRASIGAVNGN